jgi:hypothetical protein
MADSTTNITQMTSSQAGKEVTFNALIDAASPSMLYGRNALTTTGLTWGYYGGRYQSTLIANATKTLTASTTNYVVAAIADGTVSVSTSTTNWDDDSTYIRLYKIVTGASTITSYEDHRAASGGCGSLPSDATFNNLTASTSLTVPTSTSPSQTAEGSIVWDSDDDRLTVGTGAGRKTLVNTDGGQNVTLGVVTGTSFAGAHNGTLGATTPAAASVTTLSAGVTTLTGPSSGRIATLNAPTNGGYVTFETGGTAYADIGSQLGLIGAGSGTNLIISARSGNSTILRAGTTNVATISSTGLAVTGAVSASTSINLPSYTVATLPSAATAGATCYVSNAAGNGPCIAVADGTNWKRCDNTSTTVS